MPEMVLGRASCSALMNPQRILDSSPPIRIMHVVESLAVGGAERVVVEMVNRASNRFSPFICCFTDIGLLAQSLTRDSASVFCMHKKEGNDYSIPFRLAKLLKDQNISVLQSHGWNTFCESALAAKIARVPAFVHIDHGRVLAPAVPTLKQRTKARIRRLVERTLCAGTDQIVAVSEDLKHLIATDFGIKQNAIKVIINGVDVAEESPLEARRLRASCNGSSEKLLLCSVGRLAPVKDHKTLLNAMNEVRSAIPDARLVILGDGPEREALTQHALNLGLQRSVDFLGDVGDVTSWLHKSDVFVQSSLFEGTSIAILEAMASGLPVIATSVGGNLALLKNEINGILVPPANPHLLAEQIIRLSKDRELRLHLGEEAHRNVKCNFSADQHIRTFENLYIDILSKKSLTATAE
jgi:sugar transferase (PEP-CTERM/EpsH1 system associated)